MFVFGSLAALQNSNPDFFTQSFGNFDTNLGEIRFAGFAQDHWTASPSLTLDYGLRYEYNRLPSSFPQDALNFSPRVGAAWTPLKTTIIRSGFGIFYDRFQLATINRISEFDGVHASVQIVEDTDAANLYRSGRIPSAPLAGVAPSIWTAQPGLRNPYSEVAEHPTNVTDEDFAAARASGLSEDQIFEMVVSAAIGQATRQYNTALAALDAATEKE